MMETVSRCGIVFFVGTLTRRQGNFQDRQSKLFQDRFFWSLQIRSSQISLLLRGYNFGFCDVFHSCAISWGLPYDDRVQILLKPSYRIHTVSSSSSIGPAEVDVTILPALTRLSWPYTVRITFFFAGGSWGLSLLFKDFLLQLCDSYLHQTIIIFPRQRYQI